MKKALVLLAVLVVTTPLIARNTFWGGRGTFEVYSGKCEDQGMLTFNLFHAYFKYQEPFIDINRAMASLSFAPFSFLELSGFFDLSGRTNTGFDSMYFYNNNYGPSLKLGYPFYLDADKNFYIAPGIEGFVSFALGGPILGNGTTVAARNSPEVGGHGLLSFGMGPVGLHLNGGYRMSSIATVPDRILIGAALEYAPIPFTVLLVEFHDDPPSTDIANMNYMTLTPGLRVSTSRTAGVTFDLGVAVGLGDSVPDWNGIFGMSVAFDVIQPRVAKVAQLAGKITAAETGEPVSATISFPESEVAAIPNDPVTGNYTISVPPGIYRVHVEAVDYRWKEKGVALNSGDNAILNFELGKKYTGPNLAGSVVDYNTKSPVTATISFPGSVLKPFSTDNSGRFEALISTGSYSVKAEASGYASQTLSAMVQPGVRSELNFALLRERIRLERVYFSPGSAVLLPASYPALEDAVRVLKSRPTLRVEIQGHTDSVSNEVFNMRLSQRRAEAVRNYLVMQGIEPGRLSARGYGESMPVGDNRTRAGRQLNRRIEFLILGE